MACLIFHIKGGISTFQNQLISRKETIQTQIKLIKNQLKTFPEGKLICAKNQTRYKWYFSDGHNKRYLPKRERKLAEQLALKKYLTKQLQDNINELKAIEAYLKHFPHQTAETFLANSPEFQKLIHPFYQPISEELEQWKNSPYEKNTKYSEHLIHKSSSGNIVRSKSEAMIDMLLHINKIPFRYECALQLGEQLIYPDFTIRHPKTGELYYWEHFGLMDHPQYVQNMSTKLQLYAIHGIVPTIQLITTYETREKPLSVDVVEKTIQEYFLES